MAATTNLNIRVEKSIKEQSEQIFSELGFNMTTAVNMFLRSTIREHGIPFSLKLIFLMPKLRLLLKKDVALPMMTVFRVTMIWNL